MYLLKGLLLGDYYPRGYHPSNSQCLGTDGLLDVFIIELYSY